MEHLNGNDPATPNLNETMHQLGESVETIADFYNGHTILVTGGTGFVGKALLEKLLRSCPGIDTIYVLMRPKRGLTVEQRYKDLLKNQVCWYQSFLCRGLETLGEFRKGILLLSNILDNTSKEDIH
jgi:hypothetical protein